MGSFLQSHINLMLSLLQVVVSVLLLPPVVQPLALLQDQQALAPVVGLEGMLSLQFKTILFFPFLFFNH